MLYDEIPLLKNVRIASISIGDEGNRVRVIFDMPSYADFPPCKWEACNVTVVEVEFFSISKLTIGSISNSYRGDISIEKDVEGWLEITIEGTLNLSIVAEVGLIQRISGYQENFD